MTDISANSEGAAPRFRERALKLINKASTWLDALGFAWLTPLLKIAAGEDAKEQLPTFKTDIVRAAIGHFSVSCVLGNPCTASSNISWCHTRAGPSCGTGAKPLG